MNSLAQSLLTPHLPIVNEALICLSTNLKACASPCTVTPPADESPYVCRQCPRACSATFICLPYYFPRPLARHGSIQGVETGQMGTALHPYTLAQRSKMPPAAFSLLHDCAQQHADSRTTAAVPIQLKCSCVLPPHELLLPDVKMTSGP